MCVVLIPSWRRVTRSARRTHLQSYALRQNCVLVLLHALSPERQGERILQERATLATFLCVCVIDRNSNRIVDFSRDIGYLGFDRSPFAFFVCVFIRNNNYYLYQKT